MTTEKEKLFKGPGYSRNKQEDNKDVVGAWFTHFWERPAISRLWTRLLRRTCR